MTDTRAPSALERAARRAFEVRGGHEPDATWWYALGPQFRATEIAAMRAALEALRDGLSEDVLEAGGLSIRRIDGCGGDDGERCTRCDDETFAGCLVLASASYRAMIDALLTEGQKEPGQ